MPQFGEFVYGGGLYGEQAEGYRIYLRKSAAPILGVDSPLITTTDLVNLQDVMLALLPTVADSDYFGIVTAFNAFGESDAIAHFEFRTDETGRPMLVPSPITNLRATALAGGVIELEWDYWEVNAVGVVADDFWIIGSLEPLPVIQPFEAGLWEIQEIVPHLQPRRRYALQVQLDPSPFDVEFQLYLRVLSRRDGKFEPHVSDVVVLADAAAPATVAAEMSVS